MDSVVVSSKELAVEGMEHFLKVFSFVPDDRLTWTPAPTAKSAIKIAAHTALHAARFARMIGCREFPNRDNLAQWLAEREAAEAAVTSRSEIEGIFRKGTDEVLAALDSLTPELVSMTLAPEVGPTMPMTRLMRIPGLHALSHAAQIDYLQTCWDDQVVHF